MSDIVFILGAGASVAAGAPVMSNFLDKSHDILDSKQAGAFAKDYQLVFDAIGALQAAQAKASLDLRNLEAVFTALEMVNLVRPDYFSARGLQGDPVVSLKRMIVHTLQHLIDFPVVREYIAAPGDYPGFARLVRDLREGANPKKSVAILTFNYDACLDVALHRQGMQCKYFLGDHHHVHPVCVPLLKLHGSLNWLQDPETDAIRAFRLEESHIQWKPWTGSGPYKLPLSEHATDTKFWDYAMPNGVPFLVPPTLDKTLLHRAIAPVWVQAAAELSDAQYVYVIGYSFPETDLFFKHLFAIGSVGKQPLREIQVFDPAVAAVLPRFQSMLGGGGESVFSGVQMEFTEAVGAIGHKFGC